MCWWYKSTAQGGTSTRPPNAKEAYVPITGLLWQPKAVLKVYFMNRIPGSEGWRMSSNNFVSTDNILEWANEWHKTNQNCVPKFEESRDKFDNHIRIEFEGTVVVTTIGSYRLFCHVMVIPTNTILCTCIV